MAFPQLGEFTKETRNKKFWKDYNTLSAEFAACFQSLSQHNISDNMRQAKVIYAKAYKKINSVIPKFGDKDQQNGDHMREIKEMRDQYVDTFTEGSITEYFRQQYLDIIEAQRNTATQMADQFVQSGHSRLVDGAPEGRQLKSAIEIGNEMCEDFNRIFSNEK